MTGIQKKGIGALLLLLAAMGIFLGDFAEEKREEPLKIGISVCLSDDLFVENIVKGIGEAAKAYEAETGRSVTLYTSVADGSQRTQNEQIRQYVSLGYDAICVNLVDRACASMVIDEVMLSGKEIPIIFFNREPVRQDILRAEQIYYVGSNAQTSAALQGEAVIESLQRHPEMDKNGDGILQYVLLEGELGHQDAIIRSEYVRKTIEDAGIPLQELEHGTADWQRDRAEIWMEQWLRTHGDAIELVLCNDDGMALGAADALKRAKIKAAVFGIDATEEGLQGVAEGRLWATVDCNAAGQGEMIFFIASQLATEGEISEKVPLKSQRYVRVPLKKIMWEG